MIGLIQRVDKAHVEVSGEIIGSIQRGLLALIGVQRGDTLAGAERLGERLLSYRVFPDDAGKMNLCLRDIDGGLLLVPQFTLAADTRKGSRPSFTPAAEPELGRQCFDQLTQFVRAHHNRVACGRFGADMKITLVNDGPVTFWLEVPSADVHAKPPLIAARDQLPAN